MYLLDIIEPIFDKYGHFYLKFGENVYEFSIDNKNKLELFQIYNNEDFKFEIIEDKNENKNLNLLSKSNTLKGKILREYIKEKQDNPDYECESDEELDNDTIQNINSQLQYNPEDLEYLEDNDINTNSDDEYFDNSFNIVKYGNIKLRILEELDITEINEINGFYDKTNNDRIFCGYDTYLYNGNENESELVYISKIKIISSPCKIFAYKNGDIILKIIGSSKKKYKLNIDKEKYLINLIEIEK